MIGLEEKWALVPEDKKADAAWVVALEEERAGLILEDKKATWASQERQALIALEEMRLTAVEKATVALAAKENGPPTGEKSENPLGPQAFERVSIYSWNEEGRNLGGKKPFDSGRCFDC
ncbi:hypothetical protein NDU88_006467 [Pleurodeles waltl]|uniref:Uncharacterized protein n=1 Tax=Pleurodeles waltl TaxID=8319 RepID=A0AAV7WEL0_PLEWA|nr:hypothetical protein NDU88_006467 [Pleurodeles waltl]